MSVAVFGAGVERSNMATVYPVNPIKGLSRCSNQMRGEVVDLPNEVLKFGCLSCFSQEMCVWRASEHDLSSCQQAIIVLEVAQQLSWTASWSLLGNF